MELNGIIFPAPKCSYTSESRNLLWIESHPRNSPIYHVQRKNKEIQKSCETEKENMPKISSPFFSCMNYKTDTQQEIEVAQNNFFGEKPPKEIEDTILHEFKQQFNGSPSKMRINKQVPQEQHNREGKFENLHSPIRLSQKVKNHNSSKVSTPLKKAAEFGPQLKNVISSSIPCLYLPYYEMSDKILIYFHGNAEDLGYSYDFAANLRKHLHINVLAVEYPGYGLYEGNPNSDQILSDADSVYEFVRSDLKVEARNIIIFGRSIGSGPACYLSGTRNIGGLVLMCPYTSIRQVAKHLAGGIIQYLVADRFRNIDYIKNSKCQTLFIHGKKDKLIPYQHSLDLMECIKDRSLIHLSPLMTHNEFSVARDLIAPMKTFFCQARIIVSKQKIEIPQKFYKRNQHEFEV